MIQPLKHQLRGPSSDAKLGKCTQRQFLELPPAADYKARQLVWLSWWSLDICASVRFNGTLFLIHYDIEKIIFASTMESDWRDCEQLGVANEVLNDYNEVRSGCWSL